MNDRQFYKLFRFSNTNILLSISILVFTISVAGVYFTPKEEHVEFFCLLLFISFIGIIYGVFAGKRQREDSYYQEKRRQAFILSRKKKISLLKKKIQKLEEEKQEFEKIEIHLS